MHVIFWFDINGIRRKCGRIRPQGHVRRIAHGQFQGASVYDLRVAEPDLIKCLPIQSNALTYLLLCEVF